MKKLFVLFFALILVLPFVSAANNGNGPIRSIVVFDQNIVNVSAYDAIVKGVGGTFLKELPIINGASIILPDRASERALAGRVGVLRVDPDVLVYATVPGNGKGKPGGGGTSQPPQTKEWNIERVKADLVWGQTKGIGIRVAVIDTGIDKTHPDLITNIKGGINFVGSGGRRYDPNKWNDDNGHGTHVSGIIAAADNSIGVVGVAPEAYLYGVKVLDRNGSGYLSDVIAGIDWAVQTNMDVANMSLGTNSDIQSLHDAVDVAYNSGLVLVAAAGNDGDLDPDNDIDYPARYSSVIAVAATDINNNRAPWSSDGEELELSAPGVSIRSTWKGGTYNTISGTSMASPHVAGVSALYLSIFGSSTPAQVRNALNSTALDLGPFGHDNWFGWGLVQADKAIQ